MNETRDLAGWIAAVGLSDVPKPVIEHAKLLILDTLGCMLGGSVQESNKAALRFSRATGGTAEATVVNYGDRTSAFNAAFVNASFGHGWDFDELIWPGSGHSASACTAAALALGERQLMSGRAFLEAWIAGYEAANRIGVGVGEGHMERGFHGVGIFAPFAAAGAASKAFRLNEAQTEDALAIAASQAAGTFQHSQTPGGMVKRCHMGFAASSGVRAAMLAKEGLTGPREALEGKKGFVVCYAGEDSDVEAITRDLGKTWYTPRAAIKNYACCAGQWGVLDLIYDLKAAHAFGPDDVERIRIGVAGFPEWMIGTIRGEDVKDIFAAQFSGRFGVGLALVVGDNRVRGYQHHIPPFGQSGAVVDLAKRVDIVRDEAVHEMQRKSGSRWAALGQITLKNGHTLEGRADWPRGTTGNPLTKDMVMDKFLSQALIVQPGDKAQEIARLVDGLEELDDIRGIAELMVRAA